MKAKLYEVEVTLRYYVVAEEETQAEEWVEYTLEELDLFSEEISARAPKRVGEDTADTKPHLVCDVDPHEEEWTVDDWYHMGRD